MADFGFWELVITLLVALLIAGPQRLPGIAIEIGKWVRTMRRLANELTSELTEEAHNKELSGQLRSVTQEMNKVKQEVDQAINDVNQNLRNTEPLAQALQQQIDAGQRYTSTPLSADLTEAAQASTDTPTQEQRLETRGTQEDKP